jgi:hypothetical protein
MGMITIVRSMWLAELKNGYLMEVSARWWISFPINDSIVFLKDRRIINCDILIFICLVCTTRFVQNLVLMEYIIQYNNEGYLLNIHWQSKYIIRAYSLIIFMFIILLQ